MCCHWLLIDITIYNNYFHFLSCIGIFIFISVISYLIIWICIQESRWHNLENGSELKENLIIVAFFSSFVSSMLLIIDTDVIPICITCLATTIGSAESPQCMCPHHHHHHHHHHHQQQQQQPHHRQHHHPYNDEQIGSKWRVDSLFPFRLTTITVWPSEYKNTIHTIYIYIYVYIHTIYNIQ